LLVLVLVGIAGPGRSAESTRGLADLSLEELGNIKVTSVSRTPERLVDAPASIYVISRDDIRRSGAANLPDVLRLAPNLHVAQVNSGSYAISARGLNGSNNSAPNKMLVMIDGRSVYSPLFSGVFWDAQDLVLEDIERIEVVSGPGGTLWGVNAVNAVVNIITRSAAATQGPLLSAGAGLPDSDAAFRYGVALGQSGSLRAYAKLTNRRHTETDAGTDVDDAGHKSQFGFRYDRGLPDGHFSLSGDAYAARQGQPAPGAVSVTGVTITLGDVDFSGHNVTARWDRETAAGGALQLQAYYDHTERTVRPTYGEHLAIFDLQLQHSPAAIGRHALTWGFNYRRSDDRIENSTHIAFLPARLQQTWISVFLQDRIALREDLDFTLGARVERNDYTGNEVLPSARLSWRAGRDTLLWAAASRAVRAPSRLDRDTRLPGVPPFLLDGGPEADSELADVYELGYRCQPTPRLSWSMTAFHADYDRLRTLALSPSGTSVIFASGMEGSANGIEAWGKLQANESWRLSLGWTALDETLRLKPGSIDAAAPDAEGNDPSHTWQLRSSWDLGADMEFDLGLRHVAELRNHAIPAYTAVDARLAWRPDPAFELSLAGRNLTGGHAEYGPLATRTEVERGVLLRLTWAP
jgi:iron complex outermembrane receptor protein